VKIPIENLYYLLCFASNHIPHELAFDVASIPASSDVLDLYAYLITTGTDILLRRGLDQGYILQEEQTAHLRGRINMTKTVSSNVRASPRLVCQFDELSPNVLHNQILRASVQALLYADRLSADLKNSLRSTYGKLNGIDPIQITADTFGRVQIHRNNRYYTYLLFVCRLLHSLKLPDHGSGGRIKFNDLLSDEKIMEQVFEDFLRNFYTLKQNEFYSVAPSQLRWNATAAKPEDLALLPIMKTDITMRSDQRAIIIDAKYYRSALQGNYGTEKAHSGNLYQLTAYLRSEARNHDLIVPEGILIYPVGDSRVDASFTIDGYPVRLYTLNLDQHWRNIERDLLQLVSAPGS